MQEARIALAVRPRVGTRTKGVASTIEQAEVLEIDVYDVIGDWWGEGVSAKDVLVQLRNAKNAKEINVRVNSGGGDAHDGAAIYALLYQHPAHVVVDIDGLAASAASVIAMAGDEIRMAETAMMMIHNPWTLAVGEAAGLRARADELDKVRDALATAYVARTGLDRARINELLDAETWMTAQEAFDLGFATAITPAKPVAAMLRSDLDVSRFERMPEQLKRRVQQLAEPPPQSAPPPDPAPETTYTTPPREAAQEENDMANEHSTIAHALGLPVGASESDCLAAAARMRELEVQVCAITGVQSASEALGAIRALKAGADENAQTKAELVKVRAERDRQNFDALVQRGQSAPVKLTPATAKLYQDRFTAAAEQGRGADVVAELKGFLDVAPTVVSAPREQPALQSPAGAALAHNGKTYGEMKPMERHQLWQENPELWREMKRDFETRKAG